MTWTARISTQELERQVNAVRDAWTDPERQSPNGKGCWYCHHYPPVIILSNSAACFSCFAKWFPMAEDEKVADWLLTQAERAAAWEQGKASREEANWRSLAAWLKS